MILNVGMITMISFTRKTVSIKFNYKLCINFNNKLCNSLIFTSQCVKDLGVLSVCKLFLHHHADYIFFKT
jgi:hypothetical protein